MRMLVKKTVFGTLEPDTLEGAVYLSKIPAGAVALIEIKDPRRRSVKQHRLFWALLNKVWENQSTFPTVEALEKALLIKLGYHDSYILRDGELIVIAKSISFAKMDQAEFAGLMERAVAFLCEEVVPGMDGGQLLREIDEMRGLPPLEETHAAAE